MNEKVFSALSISKKAGALTAGFDAVCAQVVAGNAKLVLFAADISPGTQKKVIRACEGKSRWRNIVLLQQDIAKITKKPVGVMAITNKDLAALCLAGLPNEEEDV